MTEFLFVLHIAYNQTDLAGTPYLFIHVNITLSYLQHNL